jgi:hypothetical protein
MTMELYRKDVRPGDLLLDSCGRPYLRVTSNLPARAAGYMVQQGEPWGEHGRAQCPSRQTSGHRFDLVKVDRNP